MRKSFVDVPRPMLASVIREPTLKHARAVLRNSEYHGATGADLHLSCLPENELTADALRPVINGTCLPVLALHYSFDAEGNSYEIDEEERTALLMTAVDAGAAAVDMQGYTFDRAAKTKFREEYRDAPYGFLKNQPKEVVLDSAVIDRQMDFIEQVHARGAQVLLSNHTGIAMTGEELVELALFLEKRKPDIIKFVTVADTEEEMTEAFRAMTMLKKEVKMPVSYHCTGRMGRLTRIVNGMLGSFMIFCNDRYTTCCDFNQPELSTVYETMENLKKLI